MGQPAKINFKEKRHKLFSLFTKHIQNFQNTILISRRRSQQRVRKRQALLHSYYIQQILTISSRYIEILPILRNIINPLIGSDVAQDLCEEMYKFGHLKWLETFRMSQHTFENLCKILEDNLCSNAIMPYHHKIGIRKIVAVALYGLATGTEYHKIAEVFNVPCVTVRKFMKLFSRALFDKLGDCLITLPKSDNEYNDIIEGFAKQTAQSLPLCIGILGHCELAIERSNSVEIDSLVVQAYIDDRLLFRQISIDLNMLTCMFTESKHLGKLPTRRIKELEIPVFLVTANNCNMPMLPWLIQGYQHPTRLCEHLFNKAMDSLLQVNQKAFNRLLGRWQILQRKTDLETDALELLIKTCCALHNLLEECEEDYKVEWEHNINKSKLGNSFKCKNNYISPINEDAFQTRDFIATSMSERMIDLNKQNKLI